MKLDGSIALVTGGAVRLGRAVCHALAERGCGIVVQYRRSKAEADELVADLASSGSFAVSLEADLSSEAGCADLVSRARDAAGRLDCLVNNASAFARSGFTDASRADTEEMLAVNLMAPLDLIRDFAARTSGGCVVNLLDQRVAGVERGCFAYSLSKKALAEATRITALELAPMVRVNAVAPGPVLPPPESSHVSEAAGEIPLGRRPLPREVAEAVLYLVEADAVTGQTIFVDGGQHLI